MTIAIVACVSIGVAAFFIARNQRTVTITFNTTVEDLSPITLRWHEAPTLPTVSREGYEFLGWYTEDNQLVDEQYFDTFDYLHDLALHPEWLVMNPITITYNAMGGTAVDPRVVPRGTTESVAGQSQRDGFYLLGWCFDAQCLSMYYPEEHVLEEDTLLYAKWIPRDLGEDVVATVTYNVMGGVEVDSATIQIGDGISFADTYREGFTLVGWYSDPDYVYPVDSDILLTQSCVLYARWAPIDTRYTVSFVSPEGAPVTESKTYAYDAIVRDADFLVPNWDKYRFNGFYLDASYTQPAVFPYNIRSDIAYYLYYERIEEIINVVTYVLYGDVVDVQQYSAGDLLSDWTPIRAGYVFDGWYSDEARSIPVDLNTTTSVNGMHIYAAWIDAADFNDDDVVYELSAEGDYVIAVGMVNRSGDALVVADTFRDLPVKAIADRAFYGCRFVTVQIGANVETIGTNAFSDNNFLESVSIPKSVTRIGEEAFARCSQLNTVTIEWRTELMDRAFDGCAQLVTVSAPNVSRVGMDAFRECILLQSVDIVYVQEIGDRAFYGCAALTDVRLANGVLAKVPSDCFSGCASLASIKLPATVKTISSNAFAGTALTYFATNGCETIKSGAFNGVATLKRVKIDAALTVLEPGVFIENFALQTIDVDERNTVYCSIAGSLYSKDGRTLHVYAGTGDTCTIGADVTEIDMIAFMYAKDLTTIVVEDGNTVYHVEDGVLYRGTTLVCYPMGRTGVTYTPVEGTTAIASVAFAYADALQAVTLPDSVTSVSPWAFYKLPNLERIECEGDVSITIGEMGEVTQCPLAEIVYI